MTDNITLPREVVKEAISAIMPFSNPRRELKQRVIEALRTHLAAPSEDIDALRRDAERYRWLRGEHSRIDPCIKANAKYKLERQSSTWVEIHDLDAAIDAAIKEDKT
jgi:hypothetical protein